MGLRGKSFREFERTLRDSRVKRQVRPRIRQVAGIVSPRRNGSLSLNRKTPVEVTGNGIGYAWRRLMMPSALMVRLRVSCEGSGWLELIELLSPSARGLFLLLHLLLLNKPIKLPCS